MSVWRQKAIEVAPELKNEFQDPDLSPYTVFGEFLSLLERPMFTMTQPNLKTSTTMQNGVLNRKNKSYGIQQASLFTNIFPTTKLYSLNLLNGLKKVFT